MNLYVVIDLVKLSFEINFSFQKFLSSLSRPLSVPDDKITRWHPKFSLDEVPDIPVDSLPEPPFVKKYQSAKDVLQDNKAKLPDRVSKENVKSVLSR